MDDGGFDEFYRDLRPRVVASVAAITGRPSLAPDCADEAFTRAYERWDRVRAMESPAGWVHATALNEARRRLRRAAHERRLLRRLAVTTAAQAPPPDWPLELWDRLRELPDRERQAMVLRHVGDLSTAGVAAAMGTTEGTARATLHRARSRLARATPEDQRGARRATTDHRTQEAHR